LHKRHTIDPQQYLTHLLTNLPATPISQISQWLPDVEQPDKISLYDPDTKNTYSDLATPSPNNARVPNNS
jgi:hypothetical protein